MMRPPLEVNNAGDALARLQFILEASGALSKDFRSDVLGWAYKAVELANKEGREEGKDQGVREAADWLERGAPTAAKWLRHDYLTRDPQQRKCEECQGDPALCDGTECEK